MSKEIKLPSGATAVIKEAEELRQRDRDKLYPILESKTAGASALSKALLALLIESWSLDLIPPSVKIESLGDLTLADYDALEEEATLVMPELFPALKAVADPKAESSNA